MDIFFSCKLESHRKILEALLLEANLGSYRYLSNGDIALPNVDDEEEFKVTVDAMRVMSFSAAEIEGFFINLKVNF